MFIDFIDFNPGEQLQPPPVACEMQAQQPGEDPERVSGEEQDDLPSETPNEPPDITTLALGEEGQQQPPTPPEIRPRLPGPDETFPVTTMMVGEEG